MILLFISCHHKTKTKEIVFVCTHGAARSPIAFAYFNKLAKENNLNFKGVFRGTKPDKALTKETILGLTNDGFKVNDWMPKKISMQDIEKAFKVVTFDCTVPSNGLLNIEEWNGTPSISKDYNTARNAIKKNVENLIDNLKKE